MKVKATAIFTTGVIAAGIAVCAFAAYRLPYQALDWRFAFLAAFTLAFGSRLSVQLPRSKMLFATSDALIFLTFLLFGGEAAILLATTEALFTSLRVEAQKANLKIAIVLSNAAIMACATAAAYFALLIYSSIIGEPSYNSVQIQEFIAVVGMLALTQFFVNTILVAVYTAFESNSTVWRAWNEKCLGSSITYFFGAAFAAVLFKLIGSVSFFTIVVVAVIVGLVYMTYNRYLEQMKRSQDETAQLENQRREDAGRHINELNKHIAEQERIGKVLRLTNERLKHAALHDALTGLPNRAFLVEQLKSLLGDQKTKTNFGVLFIDLDRFKKINDSLGHAVGDELLIMVARRLEQVVRDGDTVARLGGDEFAVILDNINSDAAAERFAQRIHEVVSQTYKLYGHQVFTAPSIGIALGGEDYEHPNDILRDADIAMYHAKERNAGWAVFNFDLRNRAIKTLRTETDLRSAIDRDELRVHYQPIVALDSGKLAGFEALMRWQHPERGLVSPAEFIPIAEEAGLIVPMTIWILREACLQLSRWRWKSAQNRNLFVSVNLSGKHFGQADLVHQISDVLRETGLESRFLKLEITEGTVMENAEDAARVLTSLRELGVQLSIDDFGTGYSSLSYLHRFPIDTLKIDRSFVSRMDKADENSVIVNTVITLAKNLNMDAIAEGVETIEQLEQLQSLGCRYAQGYLLSKPQPIEEINRLMSYTTYWLPGKVPALLQLNKENVRNLNG